MGLDKAAADAHFAVRDNDLGHWVSLLVSAETSPEGQRAVYEYRWVRTAGYEVPIRSYHLTFVNNTLVKFELEQPRVAQPSPAPHKQEMDTMCKSAIARGNRGGIEVFC